MTEQEGEVLAARLTRIWIPKTAADQSVSWEIKKGRFGFIADLENAVSFFCADDPKGPVINSIARRIFALKRVEGPK